MEVGLRRRLLEDAEGSLRQLPGDALAAVLRAEAAAAGARPRLARRSLSQPDLIGGVADVGAVTEAPSRPVIPAAPPGATSKTGATKGVEMAQTGCLSPAAQAPASALGPASLQGTVIPSSRRVDDAGPVTAAPAAVPNTLMAVLAAIGSAYAVAIEVDVDTAVPAATVAVIETGVVHTAVHSARLEGREPSAAVAQVRRYTGARRARAPFPTRHRLVAKAMDGSAPTTGGLHLTPTDMVEPQGRNEGRTERKAAVGPVGVRATVVGREPVTVPADIGLEPVPVAATDTAVTPGHAQAVLTGPRVPNPPTQGPAAIRTPPLEATRRAREGDRPPIQVPRRTGQSSDGAPTRFTEEVIATEDQARLTGVAPP